MGNTEQKDSLTASFYSFRGGTGCTLTAANIACRLAESGHQVLLVDFDLTSPGIRNLPQLAVPSQIKSAGMAEYLADAWERKTSPDLDQYLYHPESFEEKLAIMPHADPNTYGKALSVLRESSFWKDAFDPKKGSAGVALFLDLKRGWEHYGFQYIIIKSPSGLTDAGGVCARLLPDALVGFFTMGGSDWHGMSKVIEQVQEGTIFDDKITLLLAAGLIPQGEDQLLQEREAWLPDLLNPKNYPASNYFRIMLHPRLLLEEDVLHYRQQTPTALEFQRLAKRLVNLRLESN